MTFEAEYMLNEFRTRVQPSLFDEKGNRYNTTPISDREAVIMLELIDLLESEINKLEQMNNMTDATWPEPDDACPDCGEDPCICLDDKPGEEQE